MLERATTVDDLGDWSPASNDEATPQETAPETTGASRKWMWWSAGAVLCYAFGLLIAAATSPALGFFTYQGSPVLAVQSGSAAAAAGLKNGDVILAINGEPTLNAYAQGLVINSISPGDNVALKVARDGKEIAIAFKAGRTVPLGSAAGILLAMMLLMIAVFADRGTAGSLPRIFFRNTLVYVVFLAGAFSLGSAMNTSFFAIPWLFSMVLAAPVTCQHMLMFPNGAAKFSGREYAWLYGPPLLLGAALSIKHLSFTMGHASGIHNTVTLWGGLASGAMAAVYLTVGAVVRGRRLRRLRDEIDPIAARWLHIGGLVMAVPLVLAVLYAMSNGPDFVSGGFRPFVAVAMIGGAACVTLAMTRTPFGELDRMWRRSSGYLLATAFAAGLYLGLIGLLGGAASVVSGGNFHAALAATIAAAIMFGPLRVRLQKMVDRRFARDRCRARSLLRKTAEAAAATLDIQALQAGVTHRILTALNAEGVAIYVGDAQAKGGWRRVALAGTLAYDSEVLPESSLSRRLDQALTARAPRDLDGSILAVPLPVDTNTPAALVVAPSTDRRFDEEERELLSTVAAGLVVALANARAHNELKELAERLRCEVDVAERRRQEIGRLKERVEQENRELIGTLAARTGRAPVVGKGLKNTFELAQRVARSNASVLVHGETGVGKELIARAIHAGSPRRDAPFVVVDCGAIAAGVFESALFGHERGAFTGAVRAAQGAFRSANGGTIFLDEIGELPLELQPKLLRVLQEREVRPVGGDTFLPVDVRVVAGTNRDLGHEVGEGRFRQDLLYRLHVVEIEIPPLRQRRADIPALAEHFLALNAQRSGRPTKCLANDAVTALLEHDWPGNVRELENALEAAAVYADGPEIRAADLPIFEQVFRKKGKRAISENGTRVTTDGAPKNGLRETLGELEKERLVDALAEHSGNRTRTAKALGMSRGALLRRMKRYELMAH